jgi:hypothetical protein
MPSMIACASCTGSGPSVANTASSDRMAPRRPERLDRLPDHAQRPARRCRNRPARPRGAPSAYQARRAPARSSRGCRKGRKRNGSRSSGPLFATRFTAGRQARFGPGGSVGYKIRKPMLATSMTTVASHPAICIPGGRMSVPMMRGLVAISSIVAISGAARTPFRTAVQ